MASVSCSGQTYDLSRVIQQGDLLFDEDVVIYAVDIFKHQALRNRSVVIVLTCCTSNLGASVALAACMCNIATFVISSLQVANSHVIMELQNLRQIKKLAELADGPTVSCELARAGCVSFHTSIRQGPLCSTCPTTTIE